MLNFLSQKTLIKYLASVLVLWHRHISVPVKNIMCHVDVVLRLGNDGNADENDAFAFKLIENIQAMKRPDYNNYISEKVVSSHSI